ncbi:MAG: ParB/RepB/Spo0J family partition protein, partial [Candidatus Dormibacteraeota bacterium]|nr:ParB/RepB/Spo0J family partition protein [Candidatus Dormibacteraeota bacterium]
PKAIDKNPTNPRRYFNDEKLDLLRTSIQEVGVLVPLIVYRKPRGARGFILMDGERRWRCSLDIGLDAVPVNVINPPSALDNLLLMFNIHAVREEWALIAIASSLRDVIKLSGEQRESRLAEMTGLTRSAVRRAKRLLSLPESELDLIREEAHLDRADQVHREDLYLEIEAAESVLRNSLPEIAKAYSREKIIRQFARKREEKTLTAVTDFRAVGKLVKAVDEDLVDRQTTIQGIKRLIDDVSVNPNDLFDEIAAAAYEQQAVTRKAETLLGDLRQLDKRIPLSNTLATALRALMREILRLLRRA